MLETKVANEPSTQVNKSGYHVVLEFNGQTHNLFSDDIESAILSVKPLFLKTKLVINITNSEGKTCAKTFFVFPGRQLFRNKTFMKLFLNRLIFK